MAQHNEFMNNQYPYPAKPKAMWELGLQAGYAFWKGDLAARPGFGGGISIRKALGHVLSLRGQYNGMFTYGYDYRPRNPLTMINPGSRDFNPWAAYAGTPANQANNGGGVFANYRSRVHQGSLDLVASLNSISHYRGNPKNDWYLFLGYTAAANDVDVDARKGEGSSATLYNYSGVNWVNQDRGTIRTALKGIWDGDYETNAPVGYGNSTIGRIKDNYVLVHGLTTGMGFAHKLSDKFNLGIEQRFSYFFDDNMDGIAYGQGKDLLSFTTLRLNFNMGNSATHVQPLWWLNPNNFIYNELNRPTHMQLPKPVLPDADNDGVTDQFDLEPNTPAGCPVDTHGVSRDSDGDGVPDCRDKELLTQQTCFPVNADGVGNCPEPACCKELRDLIAQGGGTKTDCAISSLPSIQFKSGAVALSKDAQTVLASAAGQIRSNPNCRVRVVGYGAADKRAQQLSWDRVNAVIRYMVEQQGISEDRFIFSYGTEGGDTNTVDLQPTTEQGPNSVPAPHPNLKK
jgi:outer membrane protein OmpA-like peptidoglycan-associated protein